ncbi:MAG TPA: EexN family lipoprotein [Phenylobacterium sp.]|nr:EexN family lipoprotein [Phenylobacterium sp.]
MSRRIAVTATLAVLAGCSAKPRSVSYFASHQTEAARVAAACQIGGTRGPECTNALAGEAASKDEARLKLYRRGF